DFRPYLYKTNDYGKTWKKITSGIPNNAFTRVIREDPTRRGFFNAGTETGKNVSSINAEGWKSLKLILPVTPTPDTAVTKRNKDLVIATQGRSFWIIDDLPVLHQWKDTTAQADAHLFNPEDAYRTTGGGGRIPPGVALGENPPAGASILYY